MRSIMFTCYKHFVYRLKTICLQSVNAWHVVVDLLPVLSPAGPTRSTPEECVKVVPTGIRLIHLQLNESKFVSKICSTTSSWSRAVKRGRATRAHSRPCGPPN